MKTMLLAFCCAALIAVAADFGLHAAGFGAADHTAAPDVRVGDAAELRRGHSE